LSPFLFCRVEQKRGPLSVAELSDWFLNDAFEVSLSAIDAPELFLELPKAYKSELDKIMAPLEIEFDRYSALRAWAFGQNEDYQFEITETYSLGELNTNRRINCLLFSVMFVAAARQVNVPAEFQLVFSPRIGISTTKLASIISI
jgi:hypothetical protein